MDIGVFDHYEEDGQLSFFGFGEEDDGIWMPGDLEAYVDPEGTTVEGPSGMRGSRGDLRKEDSGREASGEAFQKPASGNSQPVLGEPFGQGIAVCACCGRMLLVTQKEGRYVSACSKCGVTYARNCSKITCENGAG